MGMELELGEVKVAQSGVVVLERGWVFGEILGLETKIRFRVKKEARSEARGGERTSSWDFNCDSCLNRAILTPRRVAGSELDIRENPSLSSRYRSYSLWSGAGSMM